ncbi:hypothetical protein J5N97_023454 [Dioscorea zingiberensis]|uniref:SET domain-containing protein n=1 Tax=Dioscorea zingiberensis TaxID=325984 RepID=A0A9D5C5R3_9LILI|nr:hypothetical protein J5N97_023454 [Dioscorea zingiberensis]
MEPGSSHSQREDRNERAKKAITAMKAMGIPVEKTKPVLKNLLKESDNSWGYIEADNYSVLVDALIAMPESPVDSLDTGMKKMGTVAAEPLDSARKRPRVKEENSVSPSVARPNGPGVTSQRMPVSEGHADTTLPEIPFSEQDAKNLQLQPCQGDEGARNVQVSRALTVARQVGPVRGLAGTSGSLVTNQREKRPVQKKIDSLVCYKDSQTERGSLRLVSPVQLKDEPMYDAEPRFEVPLAVINPPPRLPANNHGMIAMDGPSANGGDSKENELRNGEPSNINSCSLVVFKPSYDVNDITKGEERVRIPVVNEVSSERFPPPFNYIPQNLVYQNGYINFSLARIGDEDCCADCFGDCLSESIPCACARETGGEFAYTLDGLIKKEFLDDCISMNRDPQKQRLYYCKDCPLERTKNEVFYTSEGKGWGLRTTDELPKGTFVCEYVGEIVTNMELYERTIQTTGNARHTYPVLLDADWGSERVLKDEEALCLDATFYGNVCRFVNHRCFDANMIGIPVEVETPDHHYYHLALFTTRKVEAYEELTWIMSCAYVILMKLISLKFTKPTTAESQDYGIDFSDHNHPIKAFRCRCRSKYCRDMNRPSESTDI